MNAELPPPLETICGYCKFYHYSKGQCRRHAPIAIAAPEKSPFPIMCQDETCGDFEHGQRWFEEMEKRPVGIYHIDGRLAAIVHPNTK